MRRRPLRQFLVRSVVILCLLGAGTVAGGAWHLMADLPPLTGLHEYQPSLVTRVYSADKQVIGQFFVERRILVPLDQIPDPLVKAIVATEDARFFEHRGLDFIGIARAAVTNVLSGKVRQGASTITQQLARSLFLSPKRDFQRKAKEAILAIKMEQMLGKEQILELYLNQIYFGHGAYGVQSAAQTYFGKDVARVTLAEAAYLAGLPKGPSDYSPYYHPEAARRRQALVLKRMAEERFISDDEADRTSREAVSFKRLARDEPAPHFVENVRLKLMAAYGEQMVYKGGLQVYTTLSLPDQQAATAAFQEGLRQVDKRQGYRGPLKQGANPDAFSMGTIGGAMASASVREGDLLEGVVTKVMKDGLTVVARGLTGKVAVEDLLWTKRRLRGSDPTKHVKEISAKSPGELFKVGDVIEVGVKSLAGATALFRVEQTPIVEGALLAVDPRTGAVRVMIGGYDFKRSEYNRATSARRQPGSAFKPVIYATAVSQGLSPGTPIVDSGAVYNEHDVDAIWRPENYDQKFHGLTTLRDALAHSRNAATVRLLDKLGVRPVVDLARELGIVSPLANDLSLALGSSGVTLQELTAAYGAFLNQGTRLDPYAIESVVDADGRLLEAHVSAPRDVLSKESAYLITSMMEDVIQKGTGQAAKGLGRPLAGKTGTTDDFTDAWFVGGAPNLVTGVWVGFDEIRTIGEKEAGARAALPIWIGYMKQALALLPVMPFTAPDGVIAVAIDPATGLLAPEDTDQGVQEVFVKGTEPTQRAAAKSSPSQFFKLDQM